MKNRAIYWFNFHTEDAPSVRYRGTYLLQQLESQLGFRYKHFIPHRNLTSLVRLVKTLIYLRSTRSGHLVVIQRVSSFGFYGKSLVWLLRTTRHKHHFIYDLDDAIYEEMESDAQIRLFMRQVHQVYVGSKELKQYALHHNKNVRVITTSVIADEAMATSTFKEGLRLGFIGCYWGTHYKNMSGLIFPALQHISFPIELVIIGAAKEKERLETVRQFEGNPHVQVVFRDVNDWMDEQQINAAMLDWDLGLAPLTDTIVCRAKSAFKVKQYLNLGIPAVSTNVGENKEFIVHENNGFLFHSTAELVEILNNFQQKSPEERMVYKASAKAGAVAFERKTIAASWQDALMDQLQ